MRLLTRENGKLSITRDLIDKVPQYAILSHTWAADDEEITYQELQHDLNENKIGYKKIHFCAQQAERDDLQHFWIDTCCIDKTNHVELSEAITSMFRWYQEAKICYVYLSDVSISATQHEQDLTHPSWEEDFRNSRWFTRGWTLQELLAPQHVVFFSREGHKLGDKLSLENLISEITSIPIPALQNQPMSHFTTTERMRWTQHRTTKRKEDRAYCLLGIFGVYIPLLYGEGDHAFVRLQEEINKAPKPTISLQIAQGAEFDAYVQAHQGCHPSTRTDLLKTVHDWAQDVNGKNIFWLSGMAGTGKSTVAWTVAKWLSDSSPTHSAFLGASFFFKRGEGDRATATAFFPTIANQLAHRVRHYDVFLAQAINLYPNICTKSLSEQFQKLICEPLRQLPMDTTPSIFVVVVDALDECNKESDIRFLLQLWSKLPSECGVCLRLFLTSRPELPIRLGFKKMSSSHYQDVVLHEIPQPIIEHDILAFLTDKMAEVRDEYNLEPAGDPLNDDWPGPDMLLHLTQIAVPLFIVAATIYRFICDADRPQDGLDLILQSGTNSHLGDVGDVYKTVLLNVAASIRDKVAKEKIYDEFKVIVGTIVCLVEPLSRLALATLLNIPPSDVQLRLRSLHAVLYVPEHGDVPVRPMHLSFSEYITSEAARNEGFAVNAASTHHIIWQKCLRLLSSSDGLREDICRLGRPGYLRSDVTPSLISLYLPPAMQYACRYWVHHLRSSAFMLCDGDDVHLFLQHHFLHWLEVLSLLNRLGNSIELIDQLLNLTETDNAGQAIAFLNDARRFVMANRFMINLAPLQLYSSALALAPRHSVVRDVCGPPVPWIQQNRVWPLTWTNELQILRGHGRPVDKVQFSSDDSLVATLSSRKAVVRLFNSSTGEEIYRSEGHCCDDLAISSDCSMLASRRRGADISSAGNSILIQNMLTGEVIRVIEEVNGEKVYFEEAHGKDFDPLVFSHSGSMLAWVSATGTALLWNLSTGSIIKRLSLSIRWNTKVTFSSDDSQLSTISFDGTWMLWDVATGRVVRKLDNLIQSSASYVTVSHDHSMVVFIVPDKGAYLYDLRASGKQRLWFRYSPWIDRLAFSPDDTLIVVLSRSRFMEMWNARTGQKVWSGSPRISDTVAFSHRYSLIAWAADDYTVRIWDLSAIFKAEVQGQHEYQSPCEFVLFSKDGSLLISWSYRGRMRVWNTCTGEIIVSNDDNKDSVADVAISSDGSTIAWVDFNTDLVHISNLCTGQRVQLLITQKMEFKILLHKHHKITLSPNGVLLASSCEGGSIVIWDTNTGQDLQRLEWRHHSIRALTFSPDGSKLVSGDDGRAFPFEVGVDCNTSIRIWDVAGGQLLREMEEVLERGESISAITFSHDGSTLAILVSSRPSGDYRQHQRHRHTSFLCLLDLSTSEIVPSPTLPGLSNDISFMANDEGLITNWGYVKFVAAERRGTNGVSFHRRGLFLEDEWLTLEGERLFWLPREFRKVAAVRGDLVAFGSDPEHLIFMRIRYNGKSGADKR